MGGAISGTQRQAGRKYNRTRAKPWWRVVVLAFWLGILVGALTGRVPLAAGGILEAENRTVPGPCPYEGRTIQVKAGDTLWSLAREHATVDGDTRAGVALLMEWNDLKSCVIQPGQTLLIPLGSNDSGLAGQKHPGHEDLQGR